MATQQSVAEKMVTYFQDAGDITIRKMFGEYCVYLFGKPVALICDDRLFVPPTENARKVLKVIDEAPPFPGAKPRLRVAESEWKQKVRMTKLFLALYEDLPEPKGRQKKSPPRKRTTRTDSPLITSKTSKDSKRSPRKA